MSITGPIIGGTLLAGAAGAGGILSGIGAMNSADATQNLAAQQAQVQQQQLNFAKQIYGQASPYLGEAGSYWKSLLQGGVPAMQAVGPYADLLGQQYGASGRTIAQNMPMGGERNLALAQNQIAQANAQARLYAGMQPFAAQNLQGLGSSMLGASVNAFPQANVGAGIAGLSNLTNTYGQSAQGAGNLLYNLVYGNQGGGGIFGG